jgi:hypothetical protein
MFQSLKVFLSTLQTVYRCHSAKVFIMNASSLFMFIWSTIKGFLEEHTKKKIILTKQSTCDELKELMAPHQLEQKYGGTAPNIEEPFWPPRMPSFDVGCNPDKLTKDDAEYEEYVRDRPCLNRLPKEEEKNEEFFGR